MLAAQRRARIIELMRGEQMASLRELAQALDSSVSTVRRDVEYLCSTGHLSRTHGGAMINAGPAGRSFEPAAEIAPELERAAKVAIGRAAAALIRPGQAVIFDSSSTVLEAARAAVARGIAFTAMTNDLNVARLLSGAPQVACHMTGGVIRPGSPTLMGAVALGAIQALRADIAFIGTHALAAEGLSDSSIELAEVKRAMLGAADTAVLLADASKLGARSFCRFGTLGALARIISDSRMPEAARAMLAAAGPVLELVEA